jgi:hypothetical protein
MAACGKLSSVFLTESTGSPLADYEEVSDEHFYEDETTQASWRGHYDDGSSP